MTIPQAIQWNKVVSAQTVFAVLCFHASTPIRTQWSSNIVCVRLEMQHSITHLLNLVPWHFFFMPIQNNNVNCILWKQKSRHKFSIQHSVKYFICFKINVQKNNDDDFMTLYQIIRHLILDSPSTKKMNVTLSSTTWYNLFGALYKNDPSNEILFAWHGWITLKIAFIISMDILMHLGMSFVDVWYKLLNVPSAVWNGCSR